VTEHRYFSLISTTGVMRGPEKKILPSDVFSSLVDSQGLLDKVKEDAAEYRRKVIKENEELKEKAQKDGFAEGYEAWVAQVAKLEEEIAKVRQEMMRLIMPIALKAAKKIVATELQTAPEAILDICKSTLKAVTQHKKIVLYINKRDFETIDKHKAEIKQLFEQLESLSLRERDDIEPGGCVIETEAGIINAQLKDRWISLEAAFSALGSELLKGT
jgi:type III secretion protein L